MAIYHLSVKTVSRSQGRSATAAAAYRSGTEIADGRTGEVHDYTRKAGVVHSEIILPEGTDERFQNRSVLWNGAEQAETRKNSTVAREYEVALPAELDGKEREVLASEFGSWLSERFGVGVDVCIHEPHREGDDRNHHAHILTTTRELDGDKLGKKTRELDQKKSGAIEEVRGKWGEMVNDALEKNKSLERVDHRSNERRGLEAAPTKHEGPSRTAMKRRGEDTDLVKENREIRQANALLQQLKERFREFKERLKERLSGLHKETRPGAAIGMARASEVKPKRSLAGRLNDRLKAEREARLGKRLASALTGLEKMERLEKAGKPVDPEQRREHQTTVYKSIEKDRGLVDKLKPQEQRTAVQAVQTIQKSRETGLGRDLGFSR